MEQHADGIPLSGIESHLMVECCRRQPPPPHTTTTGAAKRGKICLTLGRPIWGGWELLLHERRAGPSSPCLMCGGRDLGLMLPWASVQGRQVQASGLRFVWDGWAQVEKAGDWELLWAGSPHVAWGKWEQAGSPQFDQGRQMGPKSQQLLLWDCSSFLLSTLSIEQHRQGKQRPFWPHRPSLVFFIAVINPRRGKSANGTIILQT